MFPGSCGKLTEAEVGGKHLVELILLGEGDRLAPAQVGLVDVCCDAPELHEIVALQPRGQPNLHHMQNISTAISGSQHYVLNRLGPSHMAFGLATLI